MARGAQNPSHPGFVGRAEPYDCTQCIGWHATAYDFPPLDGDAVEAWNLYLLLQDQQRIGMEPIGLDYSVLPVVWDVYDIPRWRRRRLFEQLVTLNHAFGGHRAREREREMEQRQAQRALR